AALDARADMNRAFVRHFDACLGCMACVTACPSGVQYSPLIEATRGQIERRFDRSLADRVFRALVFALFPYPARMRIALAPLAILQYVGRPFQGRHDLRDRRNPHDRGEPERVALQPPGLLARLRAMLELAPPVTWGSLFSRVPARTPAVGERRMTVGLLTGCVQRAVFPQVNTATVNVLAAEGCDVVAPADQGCCGALALHAGRLDGPRAAPETCCGSAGIYRLVDADGARDIGDRKAAHIEAGQADVVATANTGCTLKIVGAARRRGAAVVGRHPIELLDASIGEKGV